MLFCSRSRGFLFAAYSQRTHQAGPCNKRSFRRGIIKSQLVETRRDTMPGKVQSDKWRQARTVRLRFKITITPTKSADALTESVRLPDSRSVRGCPSPVPK